MTTARTRVARNDSLVIDLRKPMPDKTRRVRIPRIIDDLAALFAAIWAAYGVADASTSYSRTFIVIGVIAWVLTAIRAHSLPNRTGAALIVLTALTGASIYWSVAPVETRSTFRQTLALAVLFLLIRHVSSTFRGMRAVLLGTVCGSLISVWDIYRHLGTLRLASGYGDITRENLNGLDPNYLAYGLVTALLALYLLWLHTVNKTADRRLLFAVVAVILLVGVNQTGTRGALVGIVLLVPLLVAARVSAVTALRAAIAGAMAFALLIMTGLINPIVHAVITPSVRDNGTLNGRLPTWDSARQVFESNPIMGIGAGAFRTVNPAQIVAHNGFLEIATGLGVVGLFAFLYFLWHTLLVDTRYLAASYRAQTVGAFIVITAPCVLSGHWIYATPMWAMLAVISRQGQTTSSVSDGRIVPDSDRDRRVL